MWDVRLVSGFVVQVECRREFCVTAGELFLAKDKFIHLLMNPLARHDLLACNTVNLRTQCRDAFFVDAPLMMIARRGHRRSNMVVLKQEIAGRADHADADGNNGKARCHHEPWMDGEMAHVVATGNDNRKRPTFLP